MLIPANAVEKVIRILDDDIDLTPGKHASIIEGTAGDLAVRATIAIAEGQFPDCQAIMPASANAKATVPVPAQALADAIKRVSVIANEQGTSIEQGKGTLLLSTSNVTLLVEGRADQVGNGTDELTATTDGNMTIALGSLFISDAVSPWKRGQFKLHFYGDHAPLLVLPVGEPAEIVLMPRAGQVFFKGRPRAYPTHRHIIFFRQTTCTGCPYCGQPRQVVSYLPALLYGGISMITLKTGNILDTDARAIAIPVNTVGVAGAGWFSRPPGTGRIGLNPIKPHALLATSNMLGMWNCIVTWIPGWSGSFQWTPKVTGRKSP